MIKQRLLRSTVAATGFGLALAYGASTAMAGIIPLGSVTPVGLGPGDETVNGGVRVGETAAGTLDVNGGSTLTVNQTVAPTATLDGARINVGIGGTGIFTIDNGTVNINAGSGRFDGARLRMSNDPAVDAPSQPGIVNMSNGAVLNIDGAEHAGIGVGRDGLGTMTATDSTINIDSANGSANIFIGGGASGQPDVEGHLTLQNTMVTIDSAATNGSSAGIFVGRTPNTVGPLATSTLTVESGSSIVMDNTGNGDTVINIGQNGANGAMTVSGGSTVTLNSTGSSQSSLSVGREGPGTGAVTVTDTGSTVTVGDFISVGRDGATGLLTVQSGGVVDNTGGTGLTRIGRTGGDGTLTVTGAGSVYGANSLQVGRDASAAGALNVHDGATVDVAGTLITGFAGAGVINIGDDPATGSVESGGDVNAHTAIVGHLDGSTGTLNVNRGGSLHLGDVAGDPDGAVLIIGRLGAGAAVVGGAGGGTVTIDQGAIPASGGNGGLLLGGTSSSPAATGDGALTVDSGGLVEVRNGYIQIGRQGAGTMNIVNGGVVNGSTLGASAVGRLAGSTGSVSISGAGSQWFAGDNLFIGTNVDLGTATVSGPGGTGSVDVADGGTLLSASIHVGATGTLSGGGGTILGNVAVAGGTLAPGNSPGTMTIIGDLDLGVSSKTLIELGGLTAGAGYDVIEVDDILGAGGVATIASGAIFDVSYFGAFTASLGDAFDVLVADDIVVSDLSAISFLMPTLALGFIWEQEIVFLEAGREALRLQVVADAGTAVPAPAGLLLFAPALGGLLLIRRRARHP